MKFKINKSEISEAVGNLIRAVSTKTSVPALEGIYITAGEDRLEMCAYDLEIGMTTVIPATVYRQGKTVLNARIFSEIVRTSPGDEISVDINEKNSAKIESGYSSFTITGTDPAEYPEMPRINDSTCVQIPGEVLKGMIRQTLFAVAEGDAKAIQQGGLFNIEGKQFDLVAVDGYRLAKRTEQVEFDDELSFVVPKKTLNELLRLLKDTQEPVEIFAGRRHILFKTENYTLISGLLEGEFLNYKAAIPSEHETSLTLNVREAIQCVERVSLLITDRLKSPVRCTFENNEINFLCTTSMGRASDRMDVNIEGQDVEIGFNNRYLLEALRNTECDEVRVQLGGPLKPMKILPKEGEDFLFLVLPVRLKSEGKQEKE